MASTPLTPEQLEQLLDFVLNNSRDLREAAAVDPKRLAVLQSKGRRVVGALFGKQLPTEENMLSFKFSPAQPLVLVEVSVQYLARNGVFHDDEDSRMLIEGLPEANICRLRLLGEYLELTAKDLEDDPDEADSYSNSLNTRAIQIASNASLVAGGMTYTLSMVRFLFSNIV